MKNSLLCLLLATLGSTALTQSSAPAALRAVQTYSGHKGPIENLAFSPDSTEVVVVAGQTAYVLNTKDYQLLRSFPMPIYTSKVSWLNREVLQVAGQSKVLQISAQDGHKIAGRQYGSAVSGDVVVRGELVAVDADQAIHLYDAATGLLARKIPYGSSYIDDFDLSLDGRRLVISDSGEGAVLYNAASGAVIRELLTDDDWPAAARFSEDGRTLTVTRGLTDDRAQILTFDAEDGRRLGEYADVPESLDTLVIGPQGKLAASNFGDAFVFDAITQALQYRFAGFNHSPLALAISPDGMTLAYGSWFGDLRFASLGSGKVTKSMTGFPGSNTWCLHISPDGKRVLTCGYDRTARVFELASGKAVASLSGHGDWVTEGAFVPGGGIITLSDETIYRWSTQGQKLGSWTIDADKVESLTVHPSGKYLAYVVDDYDTDLSEVVIRELATGRTVTRLRMPEELVSGLAFHPQGKLLTSMHTDGTVIQWDWSTGKRVIQALRADEYPTKLAYDPQGKYLAVNSPQNGINLLDATTLKVIRHVPVSRIHDFAFGNQGSQLIVKTLNALTLFEVRTGRVVQKLNTQPYGGFAVTPDGSGILMEGGPLGSPANATLYRVTTGAPFFR